MQLGAAPGPVRPDRKAHAVGHRPAGPLRQICEGEDGDRAELRQAAQVCFACSCVTVASVLRCLAGAVNIEPHNPAFRLQESDEEVRQKREQG